MSDLRQLAEDKLVSSISESDEEQTVIGLFMLEGRSVAV